MAKKAALKDELPEVEIKRIWKKIEFIVDNVVELRHMVSRKELDVLTEREQTAKIGLLDDEIAGLVSRIEKNDKHLQEVTDQMYDLCRKQQKAMKHIAKLERQVIHDQVAQKPAPVQKPKHKFWKIWWWR